MPDGLDRGNPIQTIHALLRGWAGESLFHAVGTDHTSINCDPRGPEKTGVRAGRWSRGTTDRMPNP